MNAFIEDILRQIQDLLELAPPVSTDPRAETEQPLVYSLSPPAFDQQQP